MMTPVKRNEADLVDQDHALDSYFEALLSEESPQDCGEDLFQSAGGATADDEPYTAHPPQGDAPCGGPGWAQGKFDAIIFTVDGLRLALPVVKLARIEDFPPEIHPPEQALPWYVGRFVQGETGVGIIDPAEIVIPPNHRVRSREARKHDMRHLLVIEGVPWSLACQDVEEVTIDGGHVRWRTTRTRREWLAGTVMTHACGLLDVDGLLAFIARHAPSHGMKYAFL